MATKKAGGKKSKRRAGGGQRNLQGGIFQGNAGAYAFGEQPDVALGAIYDRSGMTTPTGNTEYDAWKREQLIGRTMNNYNAALTVNKGLTYPEFLKQTYGTELGATSGMGKRARRRAANQGFDEGRLRAMEQGLSLQDFNDQFNPGAAWGERYGGHMTGLGSQGAANLQGLLEAKRQAFDNYQETTPWQTWTDFVNGVQTVKPPTYDPTAYSYHTSAGGGGGRGRGGGGGGGKKKRK